MTTPTGSSILTGPVKTMAIPSHRAKVEEQFTLADVDPIGRAEVIIYGKPGSGKTVLASTFPSPLRWLAADGKTSLKSLRWAVKRGISAIVDPAKDFVAYSPTEDRDAGVYPTKPQAFNLMCDMVDFWFSSAEVEKWQTLVIDSATEVSEWTINQGLSLNQQLPTPTKPLSGSHKINQTAKARIVTGQQDYKSAMALFEGWLSDVRAQCAKHGKNLVLICHEYEIEGENKDGDRIVLGVQPLLIGQLRQRIGKAFDDVWHTQGWNKGTGIEVKVQVHEDARTMAKTRWGDALNREEEPDFRKLIAKVKAYHGL